MEEDLICSSCIVDQYLQSQIVKEGTEGICNVCGNTGTCITLEALAHEIHIAITQHFTKTSEIPTSEQERQMEMGIDFEQAGTPIVDLISEITGLSEELAEEIRKYLYNYEFDPEEYFIDGTSAYDEHSHYEQNGNDFTYFTEWYDFERTIKTKARFFNQEVFGFLERLFDEIDSYYTQDGRPIVEEIGPNKAIQTLYRARIFNNETDLKKNLTRPARDLGTPPSQVAGSGRMNPKGIPVFYGALEKATAIAELRPPVGCFLAIAKFKISKPLRLLNLAALEAIKLEGSFFDKKYANKLVQTHFLKSLCLMLSSPVLPSDAETDYLPTQAIADYLASGKKVELDGIMFPSTQTFPHGVNVALFNKSSHVNDADKKGDSIKIETAYYGPDDFEQERFRITNLQTVNTENEDRDIWETVLSPSDYMKYQPSLEIDSKEKAIEICKIYAASYSKVPFGIKWEAEDTESSYRHPLL